MNLEEARKVYWLKSNRKTLGELLDEGYLNQSRLEWAAEKAYDPALKQAAKVILESKRHSAPVTKTEEKETESKSSETSVEIGISLERARSTTWPFGPNKGQPIGALLDSNQLTLKDLVYAVENAWDQKVKQAAIALTLVRLDQVVKEAVPKAGFVHVISGGRSYSNRKQYGLTLIQGMILGFTIALIFLLIGWSVYDFSQPHPNARPITELGSSTTQLIAVVIVLGAAALLGLLFGRVIDWLTKKLDKQIEEHRLGQEGEDNIVQLIVQALDGNWHLFRNVIIPGRNKADLDIVLVGPPGVWALEVKNFNGIYRNRGELWEYRKNKTWKKASKSPSKQANNASLRLGNFLKADHLNTFVHPAVVWASASSQLEIENPTVAIWQLSHLADELGNIWQGEKLSQAERTRIAEKLTKLCDDQKNKEKL